MISNISRVSLKTLSGLPLSDLSSLLKQRCRYIKNIVSDSEIVKKNPMHGKNREISIIKNLFKDTETIVSEVEMATNALMTKAEAYRQVQYTSITSSRTLLSVF